VLHSLLPCESVSGFYGDISPIKLSMNNNKIIIIYVFIGMLGKSKGSTTGKHVKHIKI
jgi:hypothetical protein